MTDPKASLLSELIGSLHGEPAAWRWKYEDKRYLILHRTGVEVWVSCDTYVMHPREIKFGFWQRRRLRRAVRRWKRERGNTEAAKLEAANCSAVIAMLCGRNLRVAA